jgi:hypothetical protein
MHNMDVIGQRMRLLTALTCSGNSQCANGNSSALLQHITSVTVLHGWGRSV